VAYVFRTLVPGDAPLNGGTMRPITVLAPEGTVVNAAPPAAVAAGNVETSQRIVDVLFGALAPALPDAVPAASCGTMSNVTLGGIDPRTGEPFAYYETIAGGMGARPSADGLDGVHCHMTNTLNTPIEALEFSAPVRVLRYEVRRGSGGAGRWRGGHGLRRDIQVLTDCGMSLMADRHRFAPYGLAGGEPGEPGRALLWQEGEKRPLPSKCNVRLQDGDVLSVRTPGGGGWGRPPALAP
jgi:N-methylhydantoinase B